MIGFIAFSFLCFVPLISGGDFFGDMYEFPKLLMCVVITALFIFSTMRDVWLRGKRVQFSRPVWRLMGVATLFFGIQIVSVASNQSWSISVWGSPYRYQGLVFWALCAALSINFSLWWRWHPSWHRFVIYPILLSTVVVSGVVLYDFIGFNTGLFVPPVYGLRPVGTFGNPNYAGGYIALSGAACLYLLRRVHWVRIAPLVGVFTAAIIATVSASAVVSGIAMILAYGGVRLAKRPRTMMLVLAVAFSSFVLVSLISTKLLPSEETRLGIWAVGVRAVLVRPILGWGLENGADALHAVHTPSEFYLRSVVIDRAHSLWLDTAVMSGIAGVIVRLWLMIQAGHILWVGARGGSAAAQLALVLLIGFEAFAAVNVFGLSQIIILVVSWGWYMAGESTGPNNQSD